MSRFGGRVAVVTGAGSGIGAAVARRLTADGALVAALDVDGDAARATVADAGGSIAVVADVADPGSVDAAVAAVEQQLGPVDLLAHVAGIDADRALKERLAEHRRAVERGDGERGFRGLVDLTDEQWDRVLRVNLDGTFYVVRATLRVMIPRRRGAIVTTASTAGMSGNAGVAHYAASKGGVRILTQSVAREVAPFGIRVNTIAPGATATPMFGRTPDGERLVAGTPIGRSADPDELAAAYSYLLSDDASYIVGETMNVNGGMVIQ
ncbi:SDR family NAD(P)-dependent oxidoreductase [Desertimonas flava]|uniref:SDR family NAD(P)-dependent oxidoreductase n=1 Tax=Desertimonas flava TaxID=2064846 RepID=UPI000E34DB32|nr:SDR family NAD(P)-dependent oxidoreductase [Desertimonas flava]